MKRTALFTMLCVGWVGIAGAAMRGTASVERVATTATQNVTSRTTSGTANDTSRGTSSSVVSSSRTAAPTTSSRTTAPRTVSSTQSRTATTRTVRNALKTTRAALPAQTARTAITVSRAATVPGSRAARASVVPTTPARATVTTQTFGTGYNSCRNAYFTCMDQFCANQNDTYRRCVCSSKLDEVQSREKLISQTADDLQTFRDYNLDAITKTAAEVNAMQNATTGEAIAATARDTSDSAQQLAGISAVLSGTKTKSLSTQGTLDIAGDINAIWATTTLAGGSNIANLTGEALYSAVHSQCADLVADSCDSTATLNMVISAYGMYIENDCNLLISALDKQITSASSDVRATEHEMNLARLENYNNHNSKSINECIAQVRQDITSETACGANYVHCLDITGRYLNYTTGEPIYSADFYQLGAQISLDGNILTNNTNRLLVSDLMRKREFASRGLDTCRDLADEVWSEFMRQAITEIYQQQQAKIRQVRNECLDVVNQCYDEQNNSLKDFSNVKDELLLGSRLELSEEMCREKLTTCSNLYGNGSDGMAELLAMSHNIVDQKIAKECPVLLTEYLQQLCTPPSNDTSHGYPYACRVYAPGEMSYATNSDCLTKSYTDPLPSYSGHLSSVTHIYSRCTINYTSCNENYYRSCNKDNICTCILCEYGNTCDGKNMTPVTTNDKCGTFPNSIYQKLVKYALQSCSRPSITDNTPSYETLQDINMVMDTLRVQMSQSLATECERLGGIWVDMPWVNGGYDKHKVTGQEKYTYFYNQTNADAEWGFCAPLDEVKTVKITLTCTATNTKCCSSIANKRTYEIQANTINTDVNLNTITGVSNISGWISTADIGGTSGNNNLYFNQEGFQRIPLTTDIELTPICNTEE